MSFPLQGGPAGGEAHPGEREGHFETQWKSALPSEYGFPQRQVSAFGDSWFKARFPASPILGGKAGFSASPIIGKSTNPEERGRSGPGRGRGSQGRLSAAKGKIQKGASVATSLSSGICLTPNFRAEARRAYLRQAGDECPLRSKPMFSASICVVLEMCLRGFHCRKRFLKF